MSEDLEYIKNDILKKHRVKLSDNDPVLIVYTLNQKLLEAQKATQEQLLEELKAELENISKDWTDTAKVNAEKVLNASLKASKSMLDQAIEDSSDDHKKILNEVLSSYDQNWKSNFREIKSASSLNLAASLLTTGSVLLLLVLGYLKF